MLSIMFLAQCSVGISITQFGAEERMISIIRRNFLARLVPPDDPEGAVMRRPVRRKLARHGRRNRRWTLNLR